MLRDKPHPRNIRDIALNNNDSLALLYKQSLMILAVQESIRIKLGPSLGQHLHIASLCPESIVIFTDSQAWASKLRFHTAEIISLARQTSGFARLDNVRIRVSPALLNITASRQPISISPTTSCLLTSVAGNIADTALQTVLLKLSRNVRKS